MVLLVLIYVHAGVELSACTLQCNMDDFIKYLHSMPTALTVILLPSLHFLCGSGHSLPSPFHVLSGTEHGLLLSSSSFLPRLVTSLLTLDEDSLLRSAESTDSGTGTASGSVVWSAGAGSSPTVSATELVASGVSPVYSVVLALMEQEQGGSPDKERAQHATEALELLRHLLPVSAPAFMH